MYRRRKLEKRYVVIIILLIIMVLFSIFTLGIKDGRKLTILEKSIKDSCLFVGKIVSTPFDFIDEKMKERKNGKRDRPAQGQAAGNRAALSAPTRDGFTHRVP